MCSFIRSVEVVEKLQSSREQVFASSDLLELFLLSGPAKPGDDLGRFGISLLTGVSAVVVARDGCLAI